MITVVDYGMGNVGSIHNMFKRIGVKVKITGDLDIISKAEKILLPGIGSFDSAMRRINSSGMRIILDHKALVEKVPILGICLGMQLLTRSSDEGLELGLSWIQSKTQRFPSLNGLKIPHMGWNIVIPKRCSVLTENMPEESRFYFVHSYYVSVDNQDDSLFKANYGIEFDAAIGHANIFGAQFHPEKSHKFGMQFLTNFARL